MKGNVEMNVLILSCSTGEGHNSAAQAVYKQFELENDNVIKKDFLSLYKVRKKPDFFSSCLNIITKKTPKVFGVLYKAGAIYSSTKITSPIYVVNGFYKKNLKKFVEENKIDVIVSTHLYAMECISHLKKSGDLKIKCYAVLTDYTCIPFLEETRQDGYFIPHKLLVDEVVSHGIKREIIYPTGIPVDSKFNDKLSKAEAREKLGLDINKKIILIMTGGIGCGNIAAICKKLVAQYDDNYQVLAMVGRNNELKEELEKEFANTIVKVIPFTKMVNYYMNASDVLVTKPGGISTTEAAVANIPIIHAMAIPGCETKNASFFEELGMSYNAKNEDEVFSYLGLLLNSEELRERICTNQSLVINKFAARDIVRIIKENERNN